MIICSSNNIDFIQGSVAYGNEPSITDWRIANSNGVLNIFNSKSNLGNLSILENGNISIGNASQTGSLNIYGDIDITGVYKNNSRNVINDTSNYVLATSNIAISNIRSELRWGSNYSDRVGGWGSNYADKIGEWSSNYISRLSLGGGGGGTSQWVGSSSIYYNGGNVGIGTTNPINNLHIYNSNINSSSAILSIQDATRNVLSLPPDISTTQSPVVSSANVTGSTTDKYIMLTYNTSRNTNNQTPYTLNIPTTDFPEFYSADILVVGGGGGGGTAHGGGGGAGALIYVTQVLNAGQYTINVGNGGAVNARGAVPTSGFDSSISFGGSTIFLAKGGGGGCGAIGIGGNGGSGGGGSGGPNNNSYAGGVAVSTNIPASIYGNSGGSGYFASAYSISWTGGGGGGAGAVGGNAIFSGTSGYAGAGGIGRQINMTGTATYYAGGGGGGAIIGGGFKGDGGLGGGGSGANNGVGTNGTANTGGGGGGGAFNNGDFAGGRGGSGVVIIRYRKVSNAGGNPEIKLIKGEVNDSNTDYKIGSYNGNFKIISSTSNIDTEYINITPLGAISNPSGTTSWTISSDRRIKENIEEASYDKCYENINSLGLYRFNYVNGFNNVNKDIKQLGFIAQEVNEIFPKSVLLSNNYNIPDLLSIDITQINYTLYGAVKKLIVMNEDKEARIKRLETLLNIDTSNISIYSSNLPIDTSNIAIDTSNLPIDTSNLPIDTSNLTIDTSNIPIDTSNIAIDTSNLPVE